MSQSQPEHFVLWRNVLQDPPDTTKNLPIESLVALPDPGPESSKPLWPGSRYSCNQRDEAVQRGLVFIDQIASDPNHFHEWGYDLLWCFYSIANTAKNQHLSELAMRLGREHACRWRQDFPAPPVDDSDELTGFVFGVDSSDRLLGKTDQQLKERIQEAMAQYSAIDFLEFDPRFEPPPSNVPAPCEECDRRNPRGARHCQSCNRSLVFRSPYTIWQEALVTTYTGHIYGVEFGASYRDVLQWISTMRPYPQPADLKLDQDAFQDVTYAITHLIYTLNDYGKFRLSPKWLAPEFKHLDHNLRQAQILGDLEIMGEFLDTLRAFGTDENDASVRAGVDYLLSSQNPDGSWGPMDDEVYGRYHTTWTAIDGLREYAFAEERLMFPDMLPLVLGHDVPEKVRQARAGSF